MLPLVSIITPSYNQGQFLPETIQSVLSQDYPHLEYIIIDGGSTDNSVEVIRKYANQLAWWVSERDKGHADALNKGFAHATGEILAWLNSDDTYQPGVIREAVDYMLSHPSISMVYSDANLIDESGKYLGRFPAKQTDYGRMLNGSVNIPQATTFFWMRLWKQVGPLDLTLKYSFDYDLWVRLAKIAPVVYVPRTWSNFRLHEAGKTIYMDDLCYPDMIRVAQRETGKKVPSLILRWYLRRLTYAWLPIRLRVKLRQIINI
ncbi:MAG: glycosyltransferase family 2 protein [Anaerolineales bacterium]